MATRKKYDVFFLGIIFTLVLAGFFILASASLGFAAREGRSPYTPLLKQILFGGIGGIILFFITSHINYRYWKKWALPIFIIGFLTTLLVFIPSLGMDHGGAKRWISFGVFTFQPSELLKFSFVIYLSSWLANKQRDLSSFKTGLVPFIIIVGVVAAALLFQPDAGTLGVISITGAVLFFLAGGRFTQIGLLISLGIVFVILLALIRPYMWERIMVFQNESYDLQGAGYQLKQSKIALGSGGILGLGFAQGVSKFNYLPEPTGDSIFAIVGEEFGFIGTTLLIILFFAFFYKSMRLALKTNNHFGKLLVAGIAVLITAQSFINMCAIVGLIPLTGLPLVFVSQGGSSMAMALAEVGVILNVSKNYNN